MNEIPEKLKNKRRKVGTCDFDCPNCGRHYHRTLWEDAGEWSRTEGKNDWKIEWGSGPITAVVDCSCGKTWLAAETNYDGEVDLFDITKGEGR